MVTFLVVNNNFLNFELNKRQSSHSSSEVGKTQPSYRRRSCFLLLALLGDTLGSPSCVLYRGEIIYHWFSGPYHWMLALRRHSWALVWLTSSKHLTISVTIMSDIVVVFFQTQACYLFCYCAFSSLRGYKLLLLYFYQDIYLWQIYHRFIIHQSVSE